MKIATRVLLFLLAAGMEICYLYACTTFVTQAVLHQTWPFPEAVGSFFLAALLTLFSQGRGWRVIYVVGFQSLVFIPALWRMVNVFGSWSDSFLSQTWLTEFFPSASSSIEYSIFILVIAWGLVFWAGGASFATRPRDYATICSRFDRGLISFFVLFFTKFYFQSAQGVQVNEPVSGFLIIPFLIFSLLAIGLVRNQSSAQRDFLPGFQTVGVMVGFIIVILLVSIGLIFFCLPYLTLAAEKGNDVLNVLSGPLISILVWIANWLFGTDFSEPDQLPAKKAPLPDATSTLSLPGWLEPIGRILALGVGIIVGLVLLAIIIGLLYAMLLWLFSKTSVDAEKPSLEQSLSSLVSQLRGLLLFFWRRAIHSGRVAHFYVALLIWGRLSNLPHFLNETPNEYGRRLKDRFPLLASEIELIVQSFNREAYGEIVSSEEQISMARSAWRKLASPFHYPLRLRSWFTRP